MQGLEFGQVERGRVRGRAAWKTFLAAVLDVEQIVFGLRILGIAVPVARAGGSGARNRGTGRRPGRQMLLSMKAVS